MNTRAAVLNAMGSPTPYAESRPLSIEVLELEGPGHGEALVRVAAAGLCHSDLSVINGDRPRPLPMVLGHEAAGVVTELGEGVTDLQPGDHVVLVFVTSRVAGIGDDLEIATAITAVTAAGGLAALVVMLRDVERVSGDR